MKVKKSKRLLSELARQAETPKEFIYSIMALQNQSATTLAENMDMTQDHFYVLISSIQRGGSFLPKTCVNLANSLDIDPYILNTVVSNYRLMMYINNQSTGTSEG